jgi:hypothetical protein
MSPAVLSGRCAVDHNGFGKPWSNVVCSGAGLQVLAYVQALRELRRNPVAANHIAVITPYRKQVQKIRTILASKGHGGVLVGAKLLSGADSQDFLHDGVNYSYAACNSSLSPVHNLTVLQSTAMDCAA